MELYNIFSYLLTNNNILFIIKIIFFAFPITFFTNVLIFKYSFYTRYSEEKF